MSNDRLVAQVEQEEGIIKYVKLESNTYIESEQFIAINEPSGFLGSIINGNKVQLFEVIPRMVQTNPNEA